MANHTKAAVAPKKAQAGGITKMEAIRQALAALGKDAMPMKIVGFIKEKYGIEMSNNAVSTYKTEINRKAGHAKSATSAVKTAAQKQPTTGSNGKAGVIGLEDIQEVKNLLGRVGASSLKSLIDMLSK